MAMAGAWSPIFTSWGNDGENNDWWAMPEPFASATKAALMDRQQLLPYRYTQAAIAHATGLCPGEWSGCVDPVHHPLLPLAGCCGREPVYNRPLYAHPAPCAAVRSLYFDWPDELDSYVVHGHFMHGPELLVVPASAAIPGGLPGTLAVSVWLPPGVWFAFHANATSNVLPYQGPNWMTVQADIATVL